MAKVTLKLDKRKSRQRKDGRFPLVLYINHRGATDRIILKYAFLAVEWNQDKQTPVGISNEKHVGVKIRSQLSRAEELIQSLQLELDTLSIKELKARISAEVFSKSSTPLIVKQKYIDRSVNTASLTDRARAKIARLEAAKKFGNRSAVQTAYNSLKQFKGYRLEEEKEDIMFVEIDYNALQNYCAYLLGKDCSPNTIRAYLAQIRALFNEAIRAKDIDKELYPFEGFKMPKSPKTKKRALRKEDIKAIRELDLERDSSLWKARNYFLFMFNNMGINFIDLVQIKKSQFTQTEYNENGNLTAGRISYSRNKTRGNFSIKLTNESLEILKEYDVQRKKPDDAIFPFEYENSERGRMRYEQYRKTVNKHIKKLAKLAGIDENVTTYFARHSWATIGKRSNLPITLISEGLGHAEIRTTQIYLDSFDDDALDAANEGITGS